MSFNLDPYIGRCVCVSASGSSLGFRRKRTYEKALLDMQSDFGPLFAIQK